MAEAIARYDATDVIEPSSGGLYPLGEIPDLTKRTLMENGYSTDGLTSGPVTPEACETADIIINMTGRPRLETFSRYDKVEDWIVGDPFGSDPTTYQRVFESIKRRVERLAMDLREKRQTKATVK
jgi:protein-tyrosine-phosphatase